MNVYLTHKHVNSQKGFWGGATLKKGEGNYYDERRW